MSARVLRTIVWDERRDRARVPWLIAIPVVGASVATSAYVAVPGELPVPVEALLAAAAPALVAVLLVMASSRWLGGRRLVDYGLAIDRTWTVDLAVGFGVGMLAVSVPFLIALTGGRAVVVTTFDSGDLALATGIAVFVLAMLFTGLWEELVLRGVFLCNAADGLRRWLSPYRAVAGGLVLSSLVFAVGHVSQTGASATLVTFFLSGAVLGVLYLLSGDLALVIGAHAGVQHHLQPPVRPCRRADREPVGAHAGRGRSEPAPAGIGRRPGVRGVRTARTVRPAVAALLARLPRDRPDRARARRRTGQHRAQQGVHPRLTARAGPGSPAEGATG